MARGTANNEPVVSQANTAEFEASYDRIFGDRPPARGRWVWDEARGKLVPAAEYIPPEVALTAPIMVDRYMEGTIATDGTDIGSRRKRRDYMREHNLADYDDFKTCRQKGEERRAKIRGGGEFDRKARHEAVVEAYREIINRKRG